MAEQNNIVLPDVILKDTLEKALAYIRAEYEGQTDKTNSLLYAMLAGIQADKYNYYEQAVAVLMTKKDNPRHFYIDLMYNMKHDSVPSMHVVLPSEQPAQNGMGLDVGSNAPIFSGTGSNTKYQEVFTRRKRATYQLVITSDNSNETVFLYHFFNLLLLSLSTTLQFKGLENISVGGGDLQLYRPQTGPSNGLFMRTISITLEYQIKAIDFHKIPAMNMITILGKPVPEIVINSDESS